MGKHKATIRPFDAANYLKSEVEIAAYLDTVLEDDDPALLAAALGDIARARGMSSLATLPLPHAPNALNFHAPL